jgi:hypothetical protein
MSTLINNDPRDLELANLLNETVRFREPISGFDEHYNMVITGYREVEHAPSYCTNLDRVQKAAATLSQTNHQRYTGYLLMQVGAENETGIHNFAALLRATPAQHVAALIKTLKKNHEDQK